MERLRQTESPPQFYSLCVPYDFLSFVASFAVWPLKVSHLPHFLENHPNGIRRLMRLPWPPAPARPDSQNSARQPTSTQSGEKILLHSAAPKNVPSMSRSFIRRIINCSSLLFFLSFAPFGQSSPSIDQYLFGLSVRISGDGGDAEDFIGTPSPLLPRRTTLMNASLPRVGLSLSRVSRIHRAVPGNSKCP